MPKHIASAFDHDLQLITAKIAEMGGLAEEQLNLTIDSLRNRDSELAAQVIDLDTRMDNLESTLETRTIEVMALRQPMASDLRELVAALKISSTLERIGDLAKNIAKRAMLLNQKEPMRVIGSIARMGQQTQSLLNEALDAYAGRDTGLAVSVWRRDVEIDEMHNSIFRELLTYMMEDPRFIGTSSQLLFVAKNIERIGDHATFIAEMAYYVCEGEQLGSNRPKSPSILDDASVEGEHSPQ